MKFMGDGEEHDSLKSMKFHIIIDIFPYQKALEWGIMTSHVWFLRALEVSHLFPLQDF